MQTAMADIQADIMQMQSEAAAQVAQLCGLVKTLQVLLVESRAQHRETACRLAAAESALATGEVLGAAARLPAAAAAEGRERSGSEGGGAYRKGQPWRRSHRTRGRRGEETARRRRRQTEVEGEAASEGPQRRDGTGAGASGGREGGELARPRERR